MAEDADNLARFVKAQDCVIEDALDELRAGQKRSHWRWFVFPQLRGLGASPTAQFYGLSSFDEVRAYLAEPILGERLRRCVEAVLSVQGRTLNDIFGSPDDLKFRSSMTLFEAATDGAEPIFSQALDVFCDGKRDERTIALLRGR